VRRKSGASRLRGSRFADMQRVSVALLERRGNPSLHREDFPQPVQDIVSPVASSLRRIAWTN